MHNDDLVFDIGAHLGDRSVAFASLGARVVALEPHPLLARWLRRLVKANARITVRAEAAGDRIGTARLAISRRKPTLSTLSASWQAAVRDSHPGFRGVRWEDSLEVPVVTLDSLIEAYGVPSFCKIDVEGFEAEVLAGLSRPVSAISVEFVAGHLEGAAACIRRLGELGAYRFNVVIGEGRDFVFESWQSAEGALEWLTGGAGGASSGDIYARVDTAIHGGGARAVEPEREAGADA